MLPSTNSYPLFVGTTDELRLSVQEDLLAPYSEPWIKTWIEHYKRQLTPDTKLRIMDVGCGHGALTIELAKYLKDDGEVIAIDNSQEQLDIARFRAQEEGITNIHFYLEDVYTLANLGLEQSCDIVHCRWLLAHVKKPELALGEMAKQIHASGTLLLEEPGGDIYTCTKRIMAIKLWILAVKIQHWLKGTNRCVAHRLLKDLQMNHGMIIEFQRPEIKSETSFHKSRFRLGIEPFIQRINLPIIKSIGNWWINSLKRMEENPEVIISSRSIYQIVAYKPDPM